MDDTLTVNLSAGGVVESYVCLCALATLSLLFLNFSTDKQPEVHNYVSVV